MIARKSLWIAEEDKCRLRTFSLSIRFGFTHFVQDLFTSHPRKDVHSFHVSWSTFVQYFYPPFIIRYLVRRVGHVLIEGL